MNLKKQIESDLRKFLKEKEQIGLSALRLLLGAIHNEEIAQKKRDKLTNLEIEKVIFSSVKRHRDSIEAFQKGQRPDLVAKEQAEMKILQGYLPKQLFGEEIKKIVQQMVEKNKGENLNFGRLMGLVMKELAGQADGKLVNQIVKEVLEEKEKK